MQTIGNDPNIYEKLTHSLAPNIHEYGKFKKGLLCLLFVGTNGKTGAGQGHCHW